MYSKRDVQGRALRARDPGTEASVAAHTNDKMSHTILKIWWTQLNTWAKANTAKGDKHKHNKRCEPTHRPVEACGKFLKFCINAKNTLSSKKNLLLKTHRKNQGNKTHPKTKKKKKNEKKNTRKKRTPEKKTGKKHPKKKHRIFAVYLLSPARKV